MYLWRIFPLAARIPSVNRIKDKLRGPAPGTHGDAALTINSSLQHIRLLTEMSTIPSAVEGEGWEEEGGRVYDWPAWMTG